MINYLYFPYDIGWLRDLTFVSLLLSIVSLWIGQKTRMLFFGLYLIFGWFSSSLEWIALLPIGLMAIFTYLQQRNSTKKILLSFKVISLLVAFGLMEHFWLGFNNWKIYSDVSLSERSLPYTLYLNLDKPLVGLFFLPTLISCKRKEEWIDTIYHVFLFSLITIPTLFFFSWLTGHVKWDPKIPFITPIWILANLFFTCTAEEAFYRGFIQKHLSESLKNFPWGQAVSISIAAILFGLDHYTGGYKYIFLATIAGIFYGISFATTKRIEVSIFTHFILNFTHLLLFSYPAYNSQ